MEFNVHHNIDDLRGTVEGVDMDKVAENTIRRGAQEVADMVRQAVVAEEKITSPALNSPYNRGPGPSLASRNAWIVEPNGNSYTVRPHDAVETRAIVLNYGYPGKITPNGDGPLRFEINGVPIYREWVHGPDPTHYWEAAIKAFESSDKLQRFAEEELGKEFRKSL